MPDGTTGVIPTIAGFGSKATGTAGAEAVKEGFLKMLMSGKGLGAAAKAAPGGAISTGLGALFLLQMIMNQIKKHTQTLVIDQPLQRQQIEAQMAASPEDVYYQSMLPQLSQQKQMAQTAMLQAILSSGGQMPTVPGERII